MLLKMNTIKRKYFKNQCFSAGFFCNQLSSSSKLMEAQSVLGLVQPNDHFFSQDISTDKRAFLKS
uniref:Uncharacterized protein n=1 Tax=Rhizophora mucronata TaxID=61149 RepID=A0A2P2Q7R0_RHIMU